MSPDRLMNIVINLVRRFAQIALSCSLLSKLVEHGEIEAS
jgi:hypothetical protein